MAPKRAASTRLICPAPMPRVWPFARVDDGVRLDVLAHTPGEEQAAEFFGRGRTPGFDVQFGFGDAGAVGILQEQSSGHMLDDGARGRGVDFDQAEILLGGKALAGFGA